MSFFLTKRDAENFYSKILKNVMPNPLSLKPQKKLNIDNNKKRILVVGSVSPWYHKGFDNLLRTFRDVNSSLPYVKLQIVGGGNPVYLIRLAEQFAIENKVEFCAEAKNIEDYYQKATMFVLRSRWEGLPMVLIEAMSQVLPCIAYDCFSGPADVIENNVDGVLIDDQNASEFSANIIALINDKSKNLFLSNSVVKKSSDYNLEFLLDKSEGVLNNH
jgi:GalNAc-alpha-(1->4)-GalNAc-alpha-(1->3)-diNAcBac-PP-undecaprenol alpha-1,4-N-acetyl-D-galactosaminyltransferase